MDNVIVVVDDAAYALQMLQPLLPPAEGSSGRPPGPTRWIVVGCAPRVTHHVSKFVTHSARENWRRKWADKVFGQVIPLLHRDGDAVVTLLAQTTLMAQTDALFREYGTARVFDARRPRVGPDQQPVTATPRPEGQSIARFAAMLAGMGFLVGLEV